MLTEKEIEEGNELIDRFIGNELPESKLNPNYEALNRGYHRSWDWLMPVVEKIEELTGNFRIVNNIAIIDADDEDGTINNFDFIVRGNSKLEVCYKMCVEFIKWYNKIQ